MEEKEIEQLIEQAFEARERSYCPYSEFAVGAALLIKTGKIYTGCNIENAAYTPTNCAERTAFFKAVSEGETEFKAIAVVGGRKQSGAGEIGLCAPCGVCRQVMLEFCGKDFLIISASDKKCRSLCTLEDLAPFGFGRDSL